MCLNPSLSIIRFFQYINQKMKLWHVSYNSEKCYDSNWRTKGLLSTSPEKELQERAHSAIKLNITIHYMKVYFV